MSSAVELLRGRAATIAADIVARAPRDSVAGIFAGGSVARGVVWAAVVGGCHEIYSDIDLYVVLAEGGAPEPVHIAVRAALEHAPRAAAGLRFLRAVDAGVYTPADLRAQPMRPGTVDLQTQRLILHGDAGFIDACLPETGKPAREEALYLLENRAWDMVAPAPGGDAERRLQAVLGLKCDLDIATAYRIAGEAEADAGTLAAAARAHEARQDLARWFATTSPGTNADVLHRLCLAWLTLAPVVLGVPPGVDLLAARCDAGRRMRNLREFVRVASALGIPVAGALAAGARRITRAPRAVLRLHALAREIERENRAPGAALAAHFAQVDTVSRLLGFGTGTLDERARAAHHAVS